jgi:hypothetical protein
LSFRKPTRTPITPLRSPLVSLGAFTSSTDPLCVPRKRCPSVVRCAAPRPWRRLLSCSCGAPAGNAENAGEWEGGAQQRTSKQPLNTALVTNSCAISCGANQVKYGGNNSAERNAGTEKRRT